MRNRTSRLGLTVLLLALALSQASNQAKAGNRSSTGGTRVSIPSLPLGAGATPVPVDPPWVARDIGRKPWEWPCTEDSAFNLPISSGASYASVGITGIWASSLPIYLASAGDPLGTFYLRDGAGQLQGDFLAQTSARSGIPGATQTALVNSSHLTPDANDQIHANLTSHVTSTPVSNYRPVRTGWWAPFHLPSAAVPLNQVDGSPDGVLDIVQPDGTVVEARGAVRVDNGLAASYGTVWDARSDCSFYQNGVTTSMVPAMVGVIRSGEISNGVIPHALTGAATDALLRGAAVIPAGGFSPVNTGGNGSGLAYGQQLAISPLVNVYTIPGLSTQGQVIAKALQDYGLFIVERGAKAGNNNTPAISLQFEAGAAELAGWISGQHDGDLAILAPYLQFVQNSTAAGVTWRAPLAPANWFDNNGDSVPPMPPTVLNVKSQPLSDGAYVTWSVTTDNTTVITYYIYRDGQLVGSVPGTVHTYHDNSYTDHPLLPGTTYHYTVRAADANGNVSVDSNAYPFPMPYFAIQVFNPDFEDNLGAWTLSYQTPNPPPSALQSGAFSGSRAAFIPPGASISQQVGVMPHQSYELDGQFSPSSNTILQICSAPNVCSYAGAVPTPGSTQTAWAPVQAVFDPGTNNQVAIQIINTGTGPALVDALTLKPAGTLFTSTPTPTSSDTLTSTGTITSTYTPPPSLTPSDTPTGTWTTPTPIATVTPTITPSPATLIVTWTPSETDLPTSTVTNTPLPPCTVTTPIATGTPTFVPFTSTAATSTPAGTSPSGCATFTPIPSSTATLTPSLPFTTTPSPTIAVTFSNHVTNCNLGQVGSLDTVVTNAQSGDTILFDVDCPDTTPITLTTPIVFSKNLIVDPGGHQETISGDYFTRVFTVNAEITVTLNHLKIVNGKFIGGYGAGIYNAGTLTLNNSSISGNTVDAGGRGGGIYNDQQAVLTISNSVISNNTAIGGGSTNTGGNGGGIFNLGTLTIDSTLVTGNSAVRGGSGHDSRGGGIDDETNNGSSLTITNSTISGNSATIGGGLASGNLTMTNSTVSNNTAISGSGMGGGIYGVGSITSSTILNNTAVHGGGVYGGTFAVGALLIGNSTLTGNFAYDDGGAVYGIATVFNSTVANNRAANGGGISVGTSIAPTLYSSIVSGNTADTTSPDIFGAITSSGHNLIGSTSGASGFVSTDQLGLNALLSQVGLNAPGTTQTLALAATSPAIGMGECSGTAQYSAVNTDQRGVARKLPLRCRCV